MILTDHEIRACLDNGQISIQPRPEGICFSPTTVDLTLDPTIKIWLPEASQIPTIKPGRPGYKLFNIIDKYTRPVTITDGFEIRPHQFVLAWTRERVTLPQASKIAARVEGKSSLARLALGVHVCAPTIHPGFDAQLQLEIVNHGPAAIELLAGMRICQLIFETTFGTPDQGYASQFAGQKPK